MELRRDPHRHPAADLRELAVLDLLVGLVLVLLLLRGALVGETLIAFCIPGDSTSSVATVTTNEPLTAVDITAAQRRVLVALCRPLVTGRYGAPASNREIADELVVAIDTVKGTLSRLYEVFGVAGEPQNRKRAALARRALQLGVVRRDEL